MIRCLKNASAEYLVQLARVLESIQRIPQHGPYSTFHNPRVELRYEYQCDRAVDLKSVFGIW
jgi:hypothetical protein